MNDCIGLLAPGLGGVGPAPPYLGISLTSPDIATVAWLSPGSWSPCHSPMSCPLSLRDTWSAVCCSLVYVTATPTATPRLQAGPDWVGDWLTALSLSQLTTGGGRAGAQAGLLSLVSLSHVSARPLEAATLLGLPGLARTQHLSLPRQKYYETIILCIIV